MDAVMVNDLIPIYRLTRFLTGNVCEYKTEDRDIGGIERPILISDNYPKEEAQAMKS